MAIPTYDLYAVLGVPVSADRPTIRRAYLRLIREFHPDRYPEDERAALHERAAKVNTAWEFLADPIKRRAYDAEHGFGNVPRPEQARPEPTPPPNPPRTPPPPPRPRQVVQIPEIVDFGDVTAGHSAKPHMVWLSFVGGSRVRSVQLDREVGQFWGAVVERAEDERSVRIFIFGLPIPATTPSGRQVDQVYVQLDEVAIDIELSVTVKSAPQPPAPIPDPPPFRPASPPPPPRRPATTPTRPGNVAAPGPRSGKSKRVVAGVVLTLVVILFGPKAWHHFGNHAQVEPSPKASGEYCSVSSNHGQMLSFYRAKPGTTERASQTPTWVIMVPHRGDPYLAWWTPQFPYWERGNQSDGPTDPAFQYFEVSAVWENGWTPLADIFADYPNLVGGPKAEAAGRQSFITKWHTQQESPRCS